MHTKALIVSLSGLFFLSACSSGGSDTDDAAAPASVDLSWTQGVFADASHFKNRCVSPRTGVDINGDAYPDKAGSALHEKHWLRAWSNNTYLWYDEIVDKDITVIADPVDYFETLKTGALTPSGLPRDRFHFAQDTVEYQQLASAGAELSYGAAFKLLATSPPREGRIAYIEPNSPASRAGLSRGATIIAIDGVDFAAGSSVALNKGLFPEVDDEAHTFTLQDLGETRTREVTLRAEVVTNEPVKDSRIIDTPSGKVAYLALNTFGTRNTEAALVNAFTTLSAEAPDDLVLDLRYNGGGFLALSSQLGYLIAGPALTNDRLFGRRVFNDKHPTTNPVTGEALQASPFVDTTIGFSVAASQPLPSLNLNRVYVLASRSTCSASEALINALRGIDVEVVLIGSTTCGKPYGFYPTDNCGTTYSTVQIRGENAKGFGDYADGFSPANATANVGVSVQGCQVTEDVLHPLGDAQEIMLKTALEYRDTSACPPIAAERALATPATEAADDLRNDPRIIKRELFEQMRLDALQRQHSGDGL